MYFSSYACNVTQCRPLYCFCTSTTSKPTYRPNDDVTAENSSYLPLYDMFPTVFLLDQINYILIYLLRSF